MLRTKLLRLLSFKKQPMIVFIVLAAFTSCFLWSTTVPLWHFPDEQAHFAQVQNLIELRGAYQKGNDLSFEIYESERILGTLRDSQGRNKFTYNPDYRLDYSDNQDGLYEDYLKHLSLASRTQFVKQEAPRYPPLFYLLTGFGYLLTYYQDLFVRVFATRFISVIIFTLIIFFSYRFANELFSQDKTLSLATIIAIVFQPMLTFVSAGINNDTLLILLSTIILYLLLRLIKSNLNPKNALLLGFTFGLGVITKQLIFLLLPALVVALIYSLIKTKQWQRIFGYLSLTILVSLPLVIFLYTNNQGFWLPVWPQVNSTSPGYQLSFFTLLNPRFIRLYRETLPWYWGVFNWLGVVLPLPVLRAIKVVILISLVGWLKYIFQKLKTRKLVLIDKQFLFLIFANFVYFLGLIVWDISLERSIGFSHGIQGRYFFLLIASHLAFLVFGLSQLISRRFKPYLILIIALLSLSLNLIALHRVLSSYYDLSQPLILINQISQYKPFFAKWPYLIIYLIGYLLSLFFLFKNLLAKIKND